MRLHSEYHIELSCHIERLKRRLYIFIFIIIFFNLCKQLIFKKCFLRVIVLDSIISFDSILHVVIAHTVTNFTLVIYVNNIKKHRSNLLIIYNPANLILPNLSLRHDDGHPVINIRTNLFISRICF